MIEMTRTVLQTQDSKFEPWRSEAEHATSRSQRLPTILIFTRGWGRNIFCFFQTGETGNQTPNSGVKGSGGNHYPRAPAHYDKKYRVFVNEILEAGPSQKLIRKKYKFIYQILCLSRKYCISNTFQ